MRATCSTFPRDGVRMVETNIEAFGIASAQSRPGALQVVRHDDEEAYASAPDRLREEYDYDVDYWPIEMVRSHLKSDRYFQGLYDASAIHIHPLNYVAGLAAGCSEAGVRICENFPGEGPQGRCGQMARILERRCRRGRACRAVP